MNSTKTGKLKPMLVYLVPVALISPSLIWISLDKSVWTWDEAVYGKASVELFYTLIYSPKSWISRMLTVLNAEAPGTAWLGQLFVPIGYLLDSIDVGLLLSILATQALTLVLIYNSIRELSGRNQSVSITGCLVAASAPLFVAMSHQYLTEPLQLLAVAWFLLIMSFAPTWSRAFILSQLLAATAVAMLAKASSPLYCIGPGLVALWYVVKARPRFVKDEWLQKRVIATLVAGILLSLAAIRWYRENVRDVIQHVSISSSGPIAEIYGKKDIFLNTMSYWLEALRNSFFLTSVFFLISSVFGLAVVRYFIKPKTLATRFTLCSSVAAFQIVIVLAVFSLSSNRDMRYLLPVLPYLALIIGWSLAQINSSILTGLTIVLFAVQLGSTYGQALGLLPVARTAPWWLLAPNTISNQRESKTLSSIISRTCAKTGSGPYWNIIGIELVWLNSHSANYVAAKNLGLDDRLGCYYGSAWDSVEFDPNKIWTNILSANIHYYIAVNPDSNPVPPGDAHLQAVNRNYLPMLKKVQGSGLFELEPPLAEDPRILIFRRK
jgi:hypothetical protein